MDAQLKRGLLDACLLSVLARGDSYGYRIAQDAMAVVQISESTLYPILRRMEQQGCLVPYHQEHNGRLRKYYRITEQGKARLAEFREQWTEVKRMVDYVLEAGDGNDGA